MSHATFELYKEYAGKWRWRLVHANGNISTDSAQGYSSKRRAKQGIESVKTNAPDASVEEHIVRELDDPVG